MVAERDKLSSVCHGIFFVHAEYERGKAPEVLHTLAHACHMYGVDAASLQHRDSSAASQQVVRCPLAIMSKTSFALVLLL